MHGRNDLQLIKSIEINYLRSLYKLEIKKVGDLNVIFGRNDSGKSNVLRALSLFFNNTTEPLAEFNFDLDMSDIRKREARDVKGKQFIWIKLTFNVPQNYIKSLGEEIEIKRQWNREGEITENVWPKELREGSSTARLTRFLNDIDYTYIPAIKDSSVYSDLVERLYGAAAETESVSQATDTFVGEVGKVSSKLTTSLAQLFGSKSSLSAPTELSQLFRSLDFSYGDEGHSLLRQKGDGIKARHIPELLRAINDGERRSKFYIWGFEEPENSLDLSSAALEANRFADFSDRLDTQIFLTSHSPAFYLAHEERPGIRRHFVSKQMKSDKGINPGNAVHSIESLDEAEMVMEAAGLLQLPYVLRSLKDMPARIGNLEKEKLSLAKKLDDLTQPTVFVEGKNDKLILQGAFVGQSGFVLKELGGTPNTIPSLLKSLETDGKLILGNKALIVFDNDPPGRSAMDKLTGGNVLDYSIPKQVAGQLSVMCLPYFDCGEFKSFMKEIGLQEKDIIFEGEFLLDPLVVSKYLSELVFERDKIHEDYYKKPQEMYLRMQSYKPPSSGWLFARTVPDALKKQVIDECSGKGDAPSLKTLVDIVNKHFS